MNQIRLEGDPVVQVQDLLNGVISESLWLCNGAPTANEKWAAAYAFVALRLLGLTIVHEKDVLTILTPGALDAEGSLNPDETDYIKWAREKWTCRLISSPPSL